MITSIVLANGDAAIPQYSVVASRSNRQPLVEHRGDLELPEVPLDRRRVRVAARALQDFEKNDVPDDYVKRIGDRPHGTELRLTLDNAIPRANRLSPEVGTLISLAETEIARMAS